MKFEFLNFWFKFQLFTNRQRVISLFITFCREKLAPQNIQLGAWCREVWPQNSLYYHHEFIKQAILNYENCKPLHQALDWDHLAEKFFILKNDKNPILQIQPQFFDIKKDLINRVCKHLRKKNQENACPMYLR